MENKQLAVQSTPEPVTVEKLKALKTVLGLEKATDAEFELYAEYCHRTALDPISNQIHFVKRKNYKTGLEKATFQTSIDGYRLIAERTGSYAGNDDYTFDGGKTQYDLIKSGTKHPTTAQATIYKIVQGQRVPFSATAQWEAYYPGDSMGFMWKKMPYLMLGKCAEALALRKAFPNDLSGLYTDEEMHSADSEVKISQQPEKVKVSVVPEESINLEEKREYLIDLIHDAEMNIDEVENSIKKPLKELNNKDLDILIQKLEDKINANKG